MALAAVLAPGSAACLLAFNRLTGFAPHSIFCAQLGFEQGCLAPPVGTIWVGFGHNHASDGKARGVKDDHV